MGLNTSIPIPSFTFPFADGTYLTQWRDVDRTCGEFAKFSKKDAAAYRKMLAEFDAIKPILMGTSFTPIGFGKPLNDQLAQHRAESCGSGGWRCRHGKSFATRLRKNIAARSCFICPTWPQSRRTRR